MASPWLHALSPRPPLQSRNHDRHDCKATCTCGPCATFCNEMRYPTHHSLRVPGGAGLTPMHRAPSRPTLFLGDVPGPAAAMHHAASYSCSMQAVPSPSSCTILAPAVWDPRSRPRELSTPRQSPCRVAPLQSSGALAQDITLVGRTSRGTRSPPRHTQSSEAHSVL